MAETSDNHIAVIGAGVIGLSVALQLARRGYLVTVVARGLPGDWDIDYAAPRAGAHCRPVLVKTAQAAFENTLMQESYKESKRIADDPNKKDAGVAFIPASKEDLAMFAAWPQYRLLNANESPSEGAARSIKAGLTYSAWVIDSPVYLKWFQRQAEYLGAMFVRARLGAAQEAAFVAQQHRQDLTLPKIVVNASGRGFGDTNCFPLRVSHHSADGHSTIIILRPHGGTVIGGPREPNNWSPNNSSSAIDEILWRVTVVCPDLPQAFTDAPSSAPAIQVQHAYVGRRPMRKGGLRLEREAVGIWKTSDNGLKNEATTISIVHCYGAGPNRYKIGWVAASRAAALVDQCFTAWGNCK
ncbi:hypothetical protein LLEC1_07497 [Akanthomyces lecanii]|uniref:FAD dependent oxidoreductase domain-containing protein n=1 Tax=Cordyceps confragosa TaxID=2714763 RepID=A0A179IND0_CORDF|nr:hypothetical protein LLEC1_07497 [Akanthomyces lecanii]